MIIGIIGAMDQEVERLKREMDITEEVQVAGCFFISGELKGKDVIVLKSGIGKVNASMGTAILHERFHPSLIINTGSAGGFSKNLSVGDIVISTKVVHHDVDVTAFDYEYGQVPGMPAMFEADAGLSDLAYRLAGSQVGDTQVEKGIIATGDSFMQEEGKVRFVRERFPEMIAAEMEAAAIAQVCHQYGTPFVIIRALSDIAGKESSVSFDEFLEKAANNAANLIMNMLESL